MARPSPDGLFEIRLPEATRRPTTACASRSRRPLGSRSTIPTGTAACSPISTCTCWAKARTTASFEKLGAHRIDHRRDGGRALRGLGAERRARQPDRRLQRLGRPRPPDAAARAGRRLGDLHPRSRRRREIQVRDPHARPATSSRRPIRSASRSRCRRSRRRSCATSRGYAWRDADWMAARRAHGRWLDRPMSIYEVHLGSWARVPEEGNRFLSYRELARGWCPTSRISASRTSSCCR